MSAHITSFARSQSSDLAQAMRVRCPSQIGAEMQRVAEQAQHAANLREAVGLQRRQMGSIDAATVAENQVCRCRESAVALVDLSSTRRTPYESVYIVKHPSCCLICQLLPRRTRKSSC